MPRSIREPELSYLPWSAICLTPSGRQDEFLASQYPDGSIVFSVRLKDERVQYLLVPPERITTWCRRDLPRLAESPNEVSIDEDWLNHTNFS